MILTNTDMFQSYWFGGVLLGHMNLSLTEVLFQSIQSTYLFWDKGQIPDPVARLLKCNLIGQDAKTQSASSDRTISVRM